MYISRVFVRNYRNFAKLDVSVQSGVSCLLGENNTGKSNLLHAIRLPLDASLSSYHRQLVEHDFHAGVNFSEPAQVIISLDFTDYLSEENESALVGQWQVAKDVARLSYRFRPKATVRDELIAGDRLAGTLTLDDYQWELTGGGKNDPSTAKWTDSLGSSIRFSDLQSFHVAFLPALRDVIADLRNPRTSPLGRLLSSIEIPEEEKKELVKILKDANEKISAGNSLQMIGTSIHEAFDLLAGFAHSTNVRLGMADPSFASIAKALTILMSNESMDDFDATRNGLGLNNLLYITILLEYFRRRVSAGKTAGQLLLVEEPEAHLHPNLQRVLYSALCETDFQCIISTHGTHISSRSPVSSIIALTKSDGPSIASAELVHRAGLTSEEVADLDRFLDATKSTLLFARKVILVEGPAELFVIPALIKKVLNIDLDRYGIVIVPIYGTHFNVYAKLFQKECLPKKCAIIADRDLHPSDATNLEEDMDLELSVCDLDQLENEFVKVFRCLTTFERALVIPGTLRMFEEAAKEVRATKLAGRIKSLRTSVLISKEERDAEYREIRAMVLRTAKRIGKARFAQIVSKHAFHAKALPKYIQDAFDWLIV